MKLPPLSDAPMLSVIIPAYNMAGFTLQTVQSVLDQTYPKIEVIIVDDGSKDGTPDKLEAAFKDRILVLRQANGGACRARNRGFAESKGELVAFLDCDDLWDKDKAARFVAAFRERPEAGMVYSFARWIDAAGRVVGPRRFPRVSPKLPEDLLLENCVSNSTPVLRRAAFEAVGLWDETIFTTADWELWLRIPENFPVLLLPEALSRSRIASHYNSRNIEQTRREWLYVLDKHKAALSPERRDASQGNMHFYLSRLHVANGDFAAAGRELDEARRLVPGSRKFAWTRRLYSLGRAPNLVLNRLWQCYTWLSCRLTASSL